MTLNRYRNLVFLLMLWPCLASSEQPGITVSPMVGVTWLDESVDDKAHLSLGLGYRFANPWALEFGYSTFDTDARQFSGEVEFSRWQLSGLYHIPGTSGRLQPYLSAGFGEVRFDGAGIDEDDDLFHVGGGFKIPLRYDWSFRGDIKFFNAGGDRDLDSALAFGLHHVLGAKRHAAPAPQRLQERDSDGDGVFDSVDQCPATPAGVTVDSSGCPLDGDADGVPDGLDACPRTPKGNRVDSRGCTLDSDRDGVPDSRDECPNSPAGSTVNSRGCPPDDDGDGVLNAVDQCPLSDPGATVDATGCAVRAPAAQVVDTDGDSVPDDRDDCPGTTDRAALIDEYGCYKELDDTVSIELDVEFDYDSAAARPSHEAEVRRVYDFMRKYRNAIVTIQGHTDSRGSEKYNQELSERRARTIAAMLVKMGIDANRVFAVGFGESRPRDTNDTEAGRQRNRRVVGVVR